MSKKEVHPLFDPEITWLTPQQVADLNMKKKLSDIARRGQSYSSEGVGTTEASLTILG